MGVEILGTIDVSALKEESRLKLNKIVALLVASLCVN